MFGELDTFVKDTNPETFWNNFDKIISITKLKIRNGDQSRWQIWYIQKNL
jgi:hypothetical protein